MIASPAYPVTQRDLVQIVRDGKRSSFMLRDALIPVEGEVLPPDSLTHANVKSGSNVYDNVRKLLTWSDVHAADQKLQAKIGRRIIRIQGRIANSDRVKADDVKKAFEKRFHTGSRVNPKFRVQDLCNGKAVLQLDIRPADRRLTINVFDPSTVGHGPGARGVLSTRDMHELFDDFSRMMNQNKFTHAEKWREPILRLDTVERGDIRFERSRYHEIPADQSDAFTREKILKKLFDVKG